MTSWTAFWLLVAIFYICKMIKYIVNKLTYNNIQAIKDIARESYRNEIQKEIDRLKMNLKKEFDDSHNTVSDILDVLYKEEK